MSALVALEGSLVAWRDRFAAVLPPGLTPERLIRTVLVSCERTPKLLECSQQSVLNAAMSAAVLGLEVDGVTGQAFLVPFGNRAQLVIGYKGYNTLAARAGITITASVVRAEDQFDWEKGTSPFVRHKPNLKAINAPIVAAYAIASAPDRSPVIEVMGIDEIMAVRDRSPGARKPDSPWNDPKVGFPAMAEKTVRRRLARSLPIGTLQLAAALDDAVDMGQAARINPGGDLIIEATGSDVAPEEPKPLPRVSYKVIRPDGTEVEFDNIERWAEAWRTAIMRRQQAKDAAGIREIVSINKETLAAVRVAHQAAVDEIEDLARLAIGSIEQQA